MYWISNICGASGNCIFFALSQQLQSVREINISHKEIRRDLVQFLENFPKLPDETELFNFVHGYPSWSDYLRSMEKDGTLGDHVILYAAANFYKTCIRVISSLGYDFMITPNYPSVIKPYPLVAGHIHEEHFVSLRLKQDLSQLISNPLNTALLCILCEDFKEAFPESRTHLYIEIVRCVLRRYEEKNGFSSDNEDKIEVYEDVLRSLGRIALQSLLKGELYVEQSKVNGNDLKALEKFGFLSVQSGGSKRKPCFRYRFLHKSFQDFFAGFHLALKNIREEDESEITNTDQRFQAELREVFLHMCGVVVDQCEESAKCLLRKITDHVNTLSGNFKFGEVKRTIELAFSLIGECGKSKESLRSQLLHVFGAHLHLKACTSEMIPRLDFFLESLSSNTILTNLKLSSSTYRLSKEHFVLISRALSVNTTLTQLDLSSNNFGACGAASLSLALSLNTSLTQLVLSSNDIGAAGAASLSQALSINATLTQWNLSSNNIAAASLSQALSVNTALTKLNLRLLSILTYLGIRMSYVSIDVMGAFGYEENCRKNRDMLSQMSNKLSALLWETIERFNVI
ncbi:Protein NLRC3 [Stylophora pistillata]|uniref:Protein NLRC3 n=1 Tax=Stylophora pistillata TaxID=50429 RepID=A0A2B4R803_STYPI|nr:Protein NLRC3 [Stylophora pistillata]